MTPRARWACAAAGAVLAAGYGLSYVARGDAAFTGAVASAFRQRPWGILVHASFGSLVLLALPFQFAPGLRERHPRLHRAAGRVYAGAALPAAGAGLYMAAHAYGGWSTRLGFALLGVGALVTTALAVAAARRRAFAAHRRWAIRSAALFFGAVTLRLELPLLVLLCGGRFRPAYLAVAWLSWVPNVLWAEWWLRRTGAASGAAAGASTSAAAPRRLPRALRRSPTERPA